MAEVFSRGAALNDTSLVKDLADIWVKELELNDRPLALSILAQRRTRILKYGYTILEGSQGYASITDGATRLVSDGLI